MDDDGRESTTINYFLFTIWTLFPVIFVKRGLERIDKG
jgi:hypothetical protein